MITFIPLLISMPYKIKNKARKLFSQSEENEDLPLLVVNLENRLAQTRLLRKLFLGFVLFFVVLDILLRISGNNVEIIFNLPSIIFTSLLWGSIFLSIAIGLNLTYKIMGFPNFAHAELLTIGGYTALFIETMNLFRVGTGNVSSGVLQPYTLVLAMFFGFVMAGLVAIVADKLIFKRLRKKNAKPETFMIASLGLALLLRGLIFVRFGGSSRYFTPRQAINVESIKVIKTKFSLNLGGKFFSSGFSSNYDSNGELSYFPISRYDVILVVALNIAVIAVYIFLKKTKLGKAMRAVADDPDLAAVSGINTESIRTLTWFIGGGIAGMGGVLLAGTVKFTPETGSLYLLGAFAIIVLGTIGSFEGAVIAAYVVGFARVFSNSILIKLATPLDRPQLSSLSEIVPFVILVLMLIFYPNGIGSDLENRKLRIAREKEMKRGLEND